MSTGTTSSSSGSFDFIGQLNNMVDFRANIKNLYDLFNNQFFETSKYNKYKYINITTTKFTQTKDTFNIFLKSQYADFFNLFDNSIAEFSKYISSCISNIKSSAYNYNYSELFKSIAQNGHDFLYNINSDRSGIKYMVENIPRIEFDIDQKVSTIIAFLYFLSMKKITNIKTLLGLVKNYFDKFDGSKCINDAILLEEFGKMDILFNNYLFDQKIYALGEYYDKIIEEIGTVKKTIVDVSLQQIYDAIIKIVQQIKTSDEILIQLLINTIRLYDEIIKLFNQGCGTILSDNILGKYRKKNSQELTDILVNILTPDELKKFNIDFSKGSSSGSANSQMSGLSKSTSGLSSPGNSSVSSPLSIQKGNDDYQGMINSLYDQISLIKAKINRMNYTNNKQEYYTRLHKISDYRTFKTQTDREPQDFIARIKLKNIGGKQNVGKYKYITEDSLGKVANNNKARELANNYNQLTDKMIETEKKIGGIQKLALNDLNKSESGYIRMRGGEQQTNDYNNLIKQYQLMAIKQNNIINEIKNIKNGNKI